MGLGTENYDNNANYIFRSNVTALGMSSITQVNDIGLDAAQISTTNNIQVNGQIYPVSAGGFVNGLGDGTTLTLAGTNIYNGSAAYEIRYDNIVVNGDITNIGDVVIGVSLIVNDGFNLSNASGRAITLNANATANIINTGTLNAGWYQTFGNNSTQGTINVGKKLNAWNNYQHTAGTLTLQAQSNSATGNASFSNLTVGTDSFDANFTIEGNLSVTGSLTATGGSFTFDGGNISGGGTVSLNNVVLNGTVTQVGTDVTIGGTITLGTNIYDVGTNALTLDDATISKTTGYIDVDENTSTLTISGTAATSIANNDFLNNRAGNLILTKANTITLNTQLQVDGALTFNNAALNLDLNGNIFAILGAFSYSAGTIDAQALNSSVQFYGTGDITLPNWFVNDVTYSFIHSRVGRISTSGDLVITQDLTINTNVATIFDIGSNSLTIGREITIGIGELDLTDNASTLIFTGTGTTIENDGFTNREIGNLTLQRNSTTTLNANLTIDGTLTLDNAGTILDISTFNLNIGGGITYNSGVIDATDNNSTLTLSGTGAINVDAAIFQNDEVGNFFISQANTVTLNDNLIVDGTITLDNASANLDINGNNLTLNGTMVRNSGGVTATNGTITIAGTGNVTIPSNFLASNTVDVLNLTKAGIVGPATNYETIITGSLNLNNAALDFDIENGAIVRLQGALNYTAGLISAQTGGSFWFNASGNEDIESGLFDGNQLWDFENIQNGILSLKGNLEILNRFQLTLGGSVLDIEANTLTISCDVNSGSGLIDATDDASTVEIAGTGATSIPQNIFVTNQVGNFTITRSGGATTYPADLVVDGTLTINSGQTFDMDGAVLTLNGGFVNTSGIVDVDDLNDGFIVSATSSIALLDPTDFVNSTFYEAEIYKALSFNNPLTIVNNLIVENGLVAFGNNQVEFQGGIILNNNGSISNGTSGTALFSNSTNLVNNSTGSISFFDVNVTGTLNSSPNITIAGDLNVSGVYNQTAGITTFTNTGLRTITNTGTLDFNDIVIDNDSDITTASSFDINGDLTLNNVNASFAATNPSNITFTTNNSQITTASDANASGTTGLSFYDLTLGASQNFTQSGAHIVYINGDYIPDNGRLTMDTGSELRFTDAAGATTFGYLNCDHLTFTGTANFNSFDIVIGCDGNITVEENGFVILNSFVNMNDNDNTLINEGANDYTNLRIARLVINGTTTTADDFSLRNSFLVDAAGDFTQTAGTINFEVFNPTVTNNATQANCVFFNVRVTSDVTSTADFIVDDDFTVVGAGDSFIDNAGAVLFRKANLVITNNGTLTFDDVEFASTVTNGSTNDNFTIGDDLVMNAGSYFTASNPSQITFSSPANGIVTTANDADGASVGLNLYDVLITGDIRTTGAHRIFVDNDFTVNGGEFEGGNNSTIYMNGTAGAISNNNILNFESLIIGANATGAYTSADDFTINNNLEVEALGLFNATDGIITIDGTSNQISNSNVSDQNLSFNDLVISSTSCNTSSPISVKGDFTVTTNSAFSQTAGSTHFDGGTTQTINNQNDLSFWDFYVDNVATTIVQTSTDIYIDGSTFEISGTDAEFKATDGTVYFSNGGGVITNNNLADDLIFHNLSFQSGSSIDLAINDEFEITGDFTFENNSDFEANGTTLILFNGNERQNITGNGGYAKFQNLSLDNSSGILLNGDIELNRLEIEKNIRLLDGNIDLNGENIVTMIQLDAYLFETGGNFENSASGPETRGHIYYEYNFTGQVNDSDLFGLGLGIRQRSPYDIFGPTILKRYHTNLEPVGGTALKRFYSIEASNPNVNSIVTINYLDSELGDIIEDNMIMLSNRTPSDNWAARTTKLQTNNNRVTHTDSVYAFDDFETIWTASEPLLLDLVENQQEEVDVRQIPNERLIAGEEYMILGFGLEADGVTDIEEVKIYLEGNSRGQLENFKLYRSDDNVYETFDDNRLLTDSVPTAIDSIRFIESFQITPDETIYFFLTSKVNDTVSVYTPKANVFVNQAGIRSVDGIVNIKTITGAEYEFQQRLDVTFNSIGIDQPPFYPEMQDKVIYGFQIKPLGNEASFGGFDLDLGNLSKEAFAGNFNIFRSDDDNFLTNLNNTKLELSEEVASDGSRVYSFDLDEEEVMELEGRYYFLVVDSISNNANEGTDFITPGIPSLSLRATEAAPVVSDTAFGITYDFKDLEVRLTNDDLVPQKNISIGLSNQTIFGFTLEPDFTAYFEELILNINLDNASPNDFLQFKLYHDENKNRIADRSEQIAIADLNGSLLTFENFSDIQFLESATNYLVTCTPKSSIDPEASIQAEIINEKYLIFRAPGFLTPGGPFSGATHSFKSVGDPATIELLSVVPSDITNGDEFEISLQVLDNEGNLTRLNGNENLVFQFSGDAVIFGSTNRSFQNGESIVTLGNFIASTTDDYSEFSFEIDTDNFGSINSEIYSVYANEPSTTPGNLVFSNGNPASSSIRIDSWDNGSGDGRIIVARVGNTPQSPVDGIDYTPVTNFNNVSKIGVNQTGPGSVVIYDGNANSSFDISSLISGEKYHFRIYEYTISNGRYNYYIPSDIPTFTYSTEDVGEQFTNNTDEDNAASIPENFVIEGKLKEEEEEDWYKNYVDADNFMIELCGDNRLFELYYQEPDGLELIRDNRNVGDACGVIIINGAKEGTYVLRVSGTDLGSPPLDYSFKITPLVSEIFSRKDCKCP